MTADLAVITMAALCLANMVMEHRWRMKTADRTRLVSPPKAPAGNKDTDEKAESAMDRALRRAG